MTSPREPKCECSIADWDANDSKPCPVHSTTSKPSGFFITDDGGPAFYCQVTMRPIGANSIHVIEYSAYSMALQDVARENVLRSILIDRYKDLERQLAEAEERIYEKQKENCELKDQRHGLRKERDQLKSELADSIRRHNDCYEAFTKERDSLRVQLEELKSYLPKVPTESYEKRMAQQIADYEAALERLTMVGMPSRPTTGLEYAQVCLEDNCKIARDVLGKWRE